MSAPYQILCLGLQAPDLVTSSFGPFVVQACQQLAEIDQQSRVQPRDVVLIDLSLAGGVERLVHWTGLSRAVLDSAVVVHGPDPTPAECLRLLHAGIRDVVSSHEASTPDILGRILRLAIERKHVDDAARRAFSIDLMTGLPNRHQLLEHMTHLLALREREPASMALIVLQLDGFSGVEASQGSESANVLRRKLAVRLRGSLRASDVVAALGPDMFAVLLAWIDADDDAGHVANKLRSAVAQPLQVAGHNVPVGVSLGLAQYPAHGKDAQSLLRHALGQVSGGQLGRLLGQGSAANDET